MCILNFRAMAVRSVDLPEPFSPAKNVTGVVNSIDFVA